MKRKSKNPRSRPQQSRMTAVDILILIVGTFLGCELGLRLPWIKAVRQILTFMTKSIAVLTSDKISDHWKERVLPGYAIRLLSASFYLTVSCVILLLPLVAAGWFITGAFESAYEPWLEISHLIIVTGVAAIYLFMRLRKARG
jgi:hypothetical protein